MDTSRQQSEDEVMFLQAPRRSMWPVKPVAAVLGVVGLVAVGATAMSRSSVGVGGVQHLMGKEERIKMIPSYPACSAAKENCIDTGCCQISGHKCYMKKNGQAQCNSTCTPGLDGFQCGQPPSADLSVPVAGELGTTLYCVSLYSENTGSSKPSYELTLLRKQREHGVSIFGCEEWDVFSDASVSLGSTFNTIQLTDTRSEWHQLKRKVSGTWVNWGIFYSVWEKIKAQGKGQSTFWTVKADADAVFIPQRLRQYIIDHNLKDTPHGMYLENCKNVQYGYFGNLEVISKTGVKALLDNLEECHESFAPCANDGCDWKYGPWGEDVFIQRCMDHHYVDKVQAFDLTRDGACEADRPTEHKKNKKWKSPDCTKELAASIHPYKKPGEYFKCMGEIMQTNYDV